MAAKKKAPSAATLSKKQMAARQRIIDRSRRDVEKAHANLHLKLKRHKRVLSAMFFVP